MLAITKIAQLKCLGW